MPLTSAQIVADALAIAKCPGFTAQGGRALNLVLADLVTHRNLKVNCITSEISVPANSNGPFNLPLNYLRTYDIFYMIDDEPYFLTPSSRVQFDSEPSKSTTSSYPNTWTSDLSPVANQLPGQLYINPRSNQQLTLTHRFMCKRDDIVIPETNQSIPWFEDQDYLIHATALRMMRITDDSRYSIFEGDCTRMLFHHLLTEGDEQQVLKTIALDPRRFRSNSRLKSTKTDPW